MLLPLLFHFNQHLNEHALLASQVCYRGLLRVLRVNPAIKANIHISGTLITALKWLDPEPLEIIRDGVKDGQFEIVGSTFAQNVLYSSDDWDNARQIELHKQVIEDTFGVTPTAFWNVERCWRQSLVPVIAGAGYHTITIEDHILEASGGHRAHIYRTRSGDHTLNIVRDDEKLKHLFNFAAWFGETQPMHTYLDQFASSRNKNSVIAYAEDAEAMGMWGYFQGVIPNQTWARLHTLLQELATRKDIQTILFSRIPPPAEEISSIADGAAAWMNASLAQTGLPYHEDGYKDWLDFNTHSPKLAKFREFYTGIRKNLQAAETTAKKKAAKKIFQLALHSYLTHQYEFGCIGIGGDTYRGWLGANAASALNASMNLALLIRKNAEPIQFTIVDEINKDGLDEWIHIDEPGLLITSPTGGRLLYWVDLETGQMFIGNPSAVVSGQYEGDSIPPLEVIGPNFWLPDESSYDSFEQIEQPRTRMAKYLPAWVWENHPDPVTLAVRDMRLESEKTFLTAQQGAFCDEIYVDDKPLFTRRDSMEVEGSREAIRFFKQLDSTVSIRKKYSLEKNIIIVNYTFTNTGEERRKVQMTTTSTLALDYAAILKHGRAALDFLDEKDLQNTVPTGSLAGVVNPMTGKTLILTASRPASKVIRSQALLGLNIGLSFEFSVSAGQSERFSVHLIHTQKVFQVHKI